MISARCLCLLLAAGCATPASTLRDDNRRLAEIVSELRSDRRAQDRKLRDLQRQLDELRARGAMDGAPPALPVEVVAPAAPAAPAPDAARVVGVTEDGTEIVYEGDAVAARPAAPSPAEDELTVAARPVRAVSPRTVAASPEIPVVRDRLEVTRHIPPISPAISPAVAPAISPAVAPPNAVAGRAAAPAPARGRARASAGARSAGDDYRAAVDLVKAARYGDALGALREFLARYPRHDYADNAQYWLGEVYYAQRDYPRALAEFRRVVEVYPRGNKVPDALLKAGYCYQAMGQSDKARSVMEQVVHRYPMSESAVLAAKRLETP